MFIELVIATAALSSPVSVLPTVRVRTSTVNLRLAKAQCNEKLPISVSDKRRSERINSLKSMYPEQASQLDKVQTVLEDLSTQKLVGLNPVEEISMTGDDFFGFTWDIEDSIEVMAAFNPSSGWQVVIDLGELGETTLSGLNNQELVEKIKWAQRAMQQSPAQQSPPKFPPMSLPQNLYTQGSNMLTCHPMAL